MKDMLRALAAAVPDIELSRPIIFFDLETTNWFWHTDRVLELTCVKVHPNKHVEVFGGAPVRINPGPGIQIDPGAARAHGISLEMVRHCPRFAAVAPALLAFFEGCDVCGYNIRQLDVLMLREEFARCGLQFLEFHPKTGLRALDVCLVFPDRKFRTLASAMTEFCGSPHAGAHTSMGDVLATMQLLQKLAPALLRVLAGQGHALPNTVAALDGWGCRNHATFCGLLRWRPTKDKLTGLEELAFCDKHAVFAEYRYASVKDVAGRPEFKARLDKMRPKYNRDFMAILDTAATGDLTDLTCVDGLTVRELLQLWEEEGMDEVAG